MDLPTLAVNDLAVIGAWERGPNVGSLPRCRWFVSSTTARSSDVYGVIAGYSGGGFFSYDSFWGKWIDNAFVTLRFGTGEHDRVSGQPIDAEVPASILSAWGCALESLEEWHESEPFDDYGALYLRRNKYCLVAERGDMYLYGLSSDAFVPALCRLYGLTASPIFEP
jgi:hypothetical protein